MHKAYPFQFVDDILHEGEKQLVGVKNVSSNEEFFTGHFPGQPVMPGVLIIESLAQASQILMSKIRKETAPALALSGVEKMRFRKPVLPGNRLILQVELVEWDGKTAKLKGEAVVGKEVAATGQIVLS